MNNSDIADKLVKGFKAYLAQTALDADPSAVKESTLFQIVQPQDRPELIRLTEQKLRESIQADLASSFDEFRTKNGSR